MASLNEPKLYSLATMQAYLDGGLDAETQSAVEKLLAENPDYALAMEGLDRHQVDSVFARDKEQKEFKAFLTGLGTTKEDKKVETQAKPQETPFEEPMVRDLRAARWWQIAAVILILILPAIYFFQKPDPTLDQIAMNYLEPYTFSTERGSTVARELDSVRDIYNDGSMLYKKDPKAFQNELPPEFEAAKQGYLQILTLPIDSLGTRQYLQAKMGLGQCLLFQGYQAEAIEQFEPIIQHGDNEWLPAAKWYKAWSLLLLQREEEAKTILVDLSRQKSDYRAKAQSLLDEL
ncbi:MAG: hypothetical protein AAF927_13140 [Bacteroidota bacterium]